MKSSTFILCICIPFLSCGAKDDPRISELQKDVVRLSEENKQQAQQIRQLQSDMQEAQTQMRAPAPAVQAAPAAARSTMTVERLKQGVAPVLEEVLRKLKESSDTPKRGEGYGMRTEFDLQHAVYGLVQTKDPRAPYAARVIVTYEKFLESHKESRSFGSGSQEFNFVYRNQKWVYQEPQ